MITTVSLVNIHHHTVMIFIFAMRTFKIYSLSNFKIYNILVLITIFTVLYITSPESPTLLIDEFNPFTYILAMTYFFFSNSFIEI